MRRKTFTTWRSGIAALALVAVALTAAGGPAGAAKPRQVAANVTINDSCSWECRPVVRRNYTANFYGRIRSAAPRCERGRTVKVVQTEQLARRRGTGVVGTVTSERDGTWFFATMSKPGFGTYRAVVTRERKGNIVCKAATSKPEPHDPF